MSSSSAGDVRARGLSDRPRPRKLSTFASFFLAGALSQSVSQSVSRAASGAGGLEPISRQQMATLRVAGRAARSVFPHSSPSCSPPSAPARSREARIRGGGVDQVSQHHSGTLLHHPDCPRPPNCIFCIAPQRPGDPTDRRGLSGRGSGRPPRLIPAAIMTAASWRRRQRWRRWRRRRATAKVAPSDTTAAAAAAYERKSGRNGSRSTRGPLRSTVSLARSL